MSVELKAYSPSGSKVNEGYETDSDEKTTESSDVKVDIPLNDDDGDEITESPDNCEDDGEQEEEPAGGYALQIFRLQNSIYSSLRDNRKIIIRIIQILLLKLYFAYFIYAMIYRFGDEGSIRLLVCTIFGVLLLLFVIGMNVMKEQRSRSYEKYIKPILADKFTETLLNALSWILKIGVFVFLVVYIIVDVAIDQPRNLLSVAGLAIYLVLFYVFSVSPAKVNWHTVFWGFALQYILALIILRQEWGYDMFKWMGDRVSEFLAYSDAGAKFVYGEEFEEHFFAFSVLSIVIFFCTVINITYYLGIMPLLIRVIGRFLAFCMGTTAAESLCAAGNIFVGMVESPMMIEPLIKDMTNSELHAVMTGGFATIAGSVLGAFINDGVPANHLIAASVMSAPAALAISKLAYPETKVSKSTSKDFYRMQKSSERNVIEAASNGASSAIKLVANIAVNVIAFLSLLKFVNATLTWFGDRVGVDELTLEFICSYVLFPIPYFMGVDVGECGKLAELIGIKTFTNEFIAYRNLSIIINNGDLLNDYVSATNGTGYWFWEKGNVILNATGTILENGVLSDRSEVIATYALCGFANFGSMGIVLGALGAMVPAKKRAMTRIVFRAMVSGSVACFMTACIAGLLYKDF